MIRAIVFPRVEGASLDGHHVVLPRDIEADFAIILVAFTREQQDDVDTWLPIARAIEQRNPRICVYELPVIHRMNRLSRFLLDSAMRRGIPDPHARHRTITLYVDKPAFRSSLGIATEDKIEVMLVDREGRVLWRRSGPCDLDGRGALESAIAEATRAVTTPPPPS